MAELARFGGFVFGAAITASATIALLDFFVDRQQIRIVVVHVIPRRSISHFNHCRRHSAHEVSIVAGENHGTLVDQQSLRQRFDGFDIQVVARFVQNQNVVVAQQQTRHAQSSSLATGEYFDFFVDVFVAEQQRSSDR